jgi:predicted transcriptional regulator
MTITLQPEMEAKLRETAQREGLDLDAFVNALLKETLEQRSRQRDEDVAAVREGLDAIREGRERPLEEFLGERRSRRSDGPPPAP